MNVLLSREIYLTLSFMRSPLRTKVFAQMLHLVNFLFCARALEINAFECCFFICHRALTTLFHDARLKMGSYRTLCAGGQGMKRHKQNKSDDKSACKRGLSVFHVTLANSEVSGEHGCIRPPLVGSPSSH